jgi:hypothetical protein
LQPAMFLMMKLAILRLYSMDCEVVVIIEEQPNIL